MLPQSGENIMHKNPLISDMAEHTMSQVAAYRICGFPERNKLVAIADQDGNIFTAPIDQVPDEVIRNLDNADTQWLQDMRRYRLLQGFNAPRGELKAGDHNI